MFHPNGNGLQIIEILKPSPVYLEIIRGNHSVTSLSCQLHSYWNPLHERRTEMQLPKHSLLQKQGCWVTAGLQQPLTVWESSLQPTKRVKSWHYPQTAQAEGNAITEVQVRSPAGRKHQAGWTVSLPPCGWHIQKQQVGKVDMWGFHGVPPTSTQSEAAVCYILHHCQVAKQRMVLKSFPPHYPRASGTQPCDITAWSRLSHCSQSTLCIGCGVPQSFLWSLSLSTYFTPAYADT